MTKTKVSPRELTVKEIAYVSGGEAGNGTGIYEACDPSGIYSTRENEGGTGRLK